MSKPPYKCRVCSRRVRRAPFFTLQDKSTRKITCYYGGDCSEAGLREADRRDPREIVLRFLHPRCCGDPAGKMSCPSGCFAVDESTAEKGAA